MDRLRTWAVQLLPDTCQSYRSTAADLHKYTTGLQIQGLQIPRERRMRFAGIIGTSREGIFCTICAKIKFALILQRICINRFRFAL